MTDRIVKLYYIGFPQNLNNSHPLNHLVSHEVLKYSIPLIYTVSEILLNLSDINLQTDVVSPRKVNHNVAREYCSPELIFHFKHEIAAAGWECASSQRPPQQAISYTHS